MTTRRLADRIEYSQPALYSHFEGNDAIMTAVALEGIRGTRDVVPRRSPGRWFARRRVTSGGLALLNLPSEPTSRGDTGGDGVGPSAPRDLLDRIGDKWSV